MNTELLQKIQHITSPTCFVLDMGKGKTETIKHYIQQNQSKKILLILNNIDQLEEFYQQIGEEHLNIWYSDPAFGKFKNITFNSVLAITKQKFFQLLIHNELEFLNQFEEYVYDEFSGLSPLTVSELVQDITSIIQKLRQNSQTSFIITLLRFFEDILETLNNSCYNDNQVYLLPVSDELHAKAMKFLEDYWKFRKDNTTFSITLDTSILIILQAICDKSVFISKFKNIHNQTKFTIAVKNDSIKTFIQNKKFIILDATGKFNEPVYNYLGVKMEYEFADTPINYNNLTINLYHLSDVKQKDSRSGDESSLDKISQLLYSENKQNLFTFAPKKSIDSLTKKFGLQQEKLYYFFSGYDIGSNAFRNETELNIISLQTYPKIFRTVYNHIFYNIPLEKAGRIENDLSEWYLLSRDLTQLIGRLRLLAQGKECSVNLISIHEKFAYLAKELHFKNCKIVIHSEEQVKRTSHQQILDLIAIRLQQKIDRDHIYIEDILKAFFNAKSTQDKFVRTYTEYLIRLGDKYDWIFTKTRGKEAYFERKNIKTDKIQISDKISVLSEIRNRQNSDLLSIVKENEGITKKELIQKYCELKKISEKTATRHIQKALTNKEFNMNKKKQFFLTPE